MRTYPPGTVTSYGARRLLERVEPLVIYQDHDYSQVDDTGIQWGLCGGLEPAMGVQEGAALVDGVAGLSPAFIHVEHKGARQHGVTWQHTVYEPAEYDMEIEFTVPPNHVKPELAASAIRRVIRHWKESWDPTRPGTLIWVTPDMGRWYCNPRLFRSPPDKQFRAQARRLRQIYKWTIRNDDAFWRGTDSISAYRFSYSLARDEFNRDDVGTLGPQWQQTYTGAGSGTFETDGNRARWFPGGTSARTVVNRLLGVNEIQTVSINGAFTGGTWTLTYSGQTTAGIAHNASAATVQTRLEDLSNIVPGEVSVTGAAGGSYVVTFIGAKGLTNQPTMTASGVGLTPGGTANAVSVFTTVDGAGPNTATDNQIVRVKLGEAYQWPFPENAHFDIWARHNGNDASPTGIRARIRAEDDIFGGTKVVLSRFNAGVETVMTTQTALGNLNVNLILAPLYWEEWSLEAGTATNARQFKLKRNGNLVFSFKEIGSGSALGASNRGSGFGVEAGAGATQTVPPTIDSFFVGDNATITQSGHVTLTNFGDQDGYPRFLAYGPFTKLRIANGPGSKEFIEFGPLTDNQIVLLTTLPRLRGVVDLSVDQPEQELDGFQEFITKLISLATNNNVPPLLEWFESLLGIRPPQGEMYSLLKGRFSKPIPPKPSGAPPTPASIAVEIQGGNADSKVVAALTPLRTWPE